MSEEIEDEFYTDGDDTEGQSSTVVNINQESLDNQNPNGQDVNMNSADDDTDTINNNNSEENQNIPAPIQGEGTSRRQQKSKEQKKEEKEQFKEEKKLKFRKALDELRAGKWKSINGCAKAHGLAQRTLHTLYSTGQEYNRSRKNIDSVYRG